MGLLAVRMLWGAIRYYMWLKEANVLTPKEKSFVDPTEGGKRHNFPSLMDKPSVYISLIVPSFKEESRLPRMMDETLVYLQRRQRRDASFTYEVIVVDDGSPVPEQEITSGTTRCALEFTRKHGATATQ